MELYLENYIDYTVRPVMPIGDGFGFRIILKYEDGSEKVKQRSGFKSKRVAEAARTEAIGSLVNHTYIVNSSVKVADFMDYWLENDIKRRVKSYETYSTFYRTVKNHIKPVIGKKNMRELSKADIQRLYNKKAEESESVAKLVRSVMNVALKFAVDKKIILKNPAENIKLPKNVKKAKYHVRNIDSQKTLRLDQIELLIEKSRDTPIYIMVLLNVLMGLRRGEIIGVKYSDIDYVNHTLRVERQLGVRMGTSRDDVSPKTFTKQEVRTKTRSSVRTLPIPDIVFEAILNERVKYEKNRNRRKRLFQDLDYICCSTYGRPRSKDYHWKYFKQLLKDNDLPDIRWHDLRSTFCTILLKENFSPKAVSKLMGHAKEIITIDVYGDNKEIISGDIPELDSFIKDVLPVEDNSELEVQILGNDIDVSEYM